jgi:putative transposase
MARIARIVASGVPHHITQRGNRRQSVFFSDHDYQTYLELLHHWSQLEGLEIWAYCLMPNHVHMVAVPQTELSLHRALKETHRRYSRHINFREGWRGYLWQGRFASYPMDETHTLRAVRYVELNPVRAGLVTAPQDWPWSSAACHISGVPSPIVVQDALAPYITDWAAYLSEPESELFHKHERTGRPLGSKDFIEHLEIRYKRSLLPQKPGPKGKKLIK